MGTSTTSRTERNPAASARLTIVAVPAGHPYVRSITADASVHVLADPPVPGAGPGVWWPPPALDPAWISGHRDDAQLLHIHFGTESFAPGHLAACVDAAHRAGWPVVFTLHDLDHPQLSDSAAYLRQLDELVPTADAVITLTHSAARVIRNRWGREAIVLAHPAVLPSHAAVASPPPGPVRRVGVHLKDLRPNVDGPGTVRALIDAGEILRADGVQVEAEIFMHDRVREEGARRLVRELCHGSAHTRLIEHPRFSDDDLHASLSTLDACVLPYRHGTHSGWLELCWDLGVPVAAPRVGFYTDQHAQGVAAFSPFDGPSLATALRTLWSTGGTRSGSAERADLIARRRRTRAMADITVARAHADLYRRLITERAA